MPENTLPVRVRERVRSPSSPGALAPASNNLLLVPLTAAAALTSGTAPEAEANHQKEPPLALASAPISDMVPTSSVVPLATPGRALVYEVGYRKPPKASQFQPGRSGNPKGRPKKHSTISGAFEAELNAKHAITVNGRAMRLTQAEIVAKQTLKKAMAGDPRATALILKLEMARKHMASSLAPRSSNPGLQGCADDSLTPIDVPFSETDRAMMTWFLSTINTGNDDVGMNAIGVRKDDRSADDSRADDDDDDQVSIARGGPERRRVP